MIRLLFRASVILLVSVVVSVVLLPSSRGFQARDPQPTDKQRLDWFVTYRVTPIWDSPTPNEGLPDPTLVYRDSKGLHFVQGPYDRNNTRDDLRQAIDKGIKATGWKEPIPQPQFPPPGYVWPHHPVGFPENKP